VDKPIQVKIIRGERSETKTLYIQPEVMKNS
jgi:hypothetical protein